jgi:hypothetical protein
MHTLFHEPWTPPPLNFFPLYPNNLKSSSTPNSMTAISNRKNQTKSKSPKSDETNRIQQIKPHFHVWVALHSPPGTDCNGCGRGTFAARARRPAATRGCGRASLCDGGRRALQGTPPQAPTGDEVERASQGVRHRRRRLGRGDGGRSRQWQRRGAGETGVRRGRGRRHAWSKEGAR